VKKIAQVSIAGIDWASEAKNRALVVLKYNPARTSIVVCNAVSPLPTTEVVRVCNDTSTAVVAVDIPFGWPMKFTDFVSKWCPQSSKKQRPPPASRDFRYRITDLVVHDSLGKWPLSVSSDRIALGARAWTQVCVENSLGERIDLTGDGSVTSSPRIIEVYPAATLAALAGANVPIEIEGYKADAEVRRRLLQALCQRFRVRFSKSVQLDHLVAVGDDSDLADAFIAALTGLIYLHKSTLGDGNDKAPTAGPDLYRWEIRRPDEKERKAAQEEGWIFYPIPRSAPVDNAKLKPK
jgi:hypothetical protein